MARIKIHMKDTRKQNKLLKSDHAKNHKHQWTSKQEGKIDICLFDVKSDFYACMIAMACIT